MIPELKEQPFDVIAPVKIEREFDYFLARESRPLHAARGAVDAIEAVVNAVIREQDFQQRDAAAIRRDSYGKSPCRRPSRGRFSCHASCVLSCRCSRTRRRISPRRQEWRAFDSDPPREKNWPGNPNYFSFGNCPCCPVFSRVSARIQPSSGWSCSWLLISSA